MKLRIRETVLWKHDAVAVRYPGIDEETVAPSAAAFRLSGHEASGFMERPCAIGAFRCVKDVVFLDVAKVSKVTVGFLQDELGLRFAMR